MMKLTSSQQTAVLYLDGDSSILAGAGSGKTLVLVEKVALLVEKLHVPLEKILVVTFTEKAAGEIKERIAKRLRMTADDLNPLPVGTIHAMAANLLRRFGEPLGINPNFRIMDDFLAGLERLRASRERFLELIEERNLEALKAVELLGLHRGIRLFLDFLSRPEKEAASPYPKVLSEISERYRSRKASLNLLDFNDLEMSLVKLLSNDEHRDRLQAGFDWIIVDEFQDVSPIQWKILSLLHHPPKSRLVIVGDPRQSIYRFRGADPSLFSQVDSRIEERGGRSFDLSENFRSTPAVIEFVNRVSKTLFSDQFSDLVPKRTEAIGFVDVLPIDAKGLTEIRATEASVVASHLQSLRDKGIPWKSMALLFRTRRSVPAYEAAFRERNVPYVTSLGEPLLERPEVITLLFLMRKIIGVSETERVFLDAGLSYSVLASFTEEIALDPLTSFIETLFEKTTPLFPEVVHRNLKAFKNLLSDLITLGIHDLKGLLENVEALREEEARIPSPPDPGQTTDVVSFMTVHASKGLEFPVVVLCDLTARINQKGRGLYVESERGELILKDKDSDAAGLKDRLVKGEQYTDIESRNAAEEIEESKRLLYVAMTRAQDRLVLPLPPKPEEKKPRSASLSWSEWVRVADV